MSTTRVPTALKVGREYLDPHNRRVTLVELKRNVEGKYVMAIVKLAGPYGATVWYPVSMLREEVDTAAL